MPSSPLESRMSSAQFKALESSLLDACRQMSRQQVIDLADSLFDFARERREETRWAANALAATHTQA